MKWMIRSGAVSLAALLLALPALAEEYEVKWSASIEAVMKHFESPVDDDGVTGFFDLYEFTADKDRDVPVQLALPELSLDVLGAEETPLLQFRFLSPTSNISLTDQSDGGFFLNQRAQLFARPEGYALDVDYRRMRTYELRLFPRPSNIGSDYGSIYNDDTGPDDRFSTQRLGAGGELRLRLGDLLESDADPLAALMPELAFRGRYEKRDGARQFRYLLDTSDVTTLTSSWRGHSAEIDQRLSTIGSGAVLTPGGLFTMVLDLDFERFRENAPAYLQSDVPDPNVRSNARTINFVPDTDRTTGSARFQRRFGERALLHGGFQGASLKQAGDYTAGQLTAGLRENAIRFYSADAAGDVALTDTISTNAYFKYDYRDNRIQRDTALFNPTQGDPNQVAPFTEALQEIKVGAEVVYRPRPAHVVAVGYRGLWVDRDLDYADLRNPTTGFPNAVIPETNSVIGPKTQTNSVYLRGRTRAARGLSLSGEAGYLNAPETGYIRELDEAAYFKFKGSYAVPISMPLTFTLSGRGEFGKNDDFRQNSVSPAAPNPSRNFERNDYGYGVTATFVPHNQVTLFGSFFQRRDVQDFNLVRSNLARTFEPLGVAVNFFNDGALGYRSNLTNALIGVSYQITEHTDVGVSYSYTHSYSHFSENDPTANVLDPSSKILSDIHNVDFNVGHWLADGLRIYAGYRYDNYQDSALVSSGAGITPAAPASAVPFDLSTQQHTVTVGITLTSDLFGKL